MALPAPSRQLAALRRQRPPAALPRALLPGRALPRPQTALRARRVQAHLPEAERRRAAKARNARLVFVLHPARIRPGRLHRRQRTRIP